MRWVFNDLKLNFIARLMSVINRIREKSEEETVSLNVILYSWRGFLKEHKGGLNYCTEDYIFLKVD